MIALTCYYKQINCKFSFLTVMLIIAVFISNTAIAVCDVIFSDVHQVAWQGDGKNIGYNVFSPQTVTQVLRFDLLRTSGTEACHIAIGITTKQHSDTDRILENSAEPTSNIKYNLFLDQELTTIWKNYKPERRSVTQDTIIVTFDKKADTVAADAKDAAAPADPSMTSAATAVLMPKAGQTEIDKQEFIVYWNVPALQMVGPGNYESNLILTAYDIDRTQSLPVDPSALLSEQPKPYLDQQQLTLQVKVEDLINCTIGKDNVYIPGSPNKYKINFGILDMEKSVEDEFYLVVRANTRFSYELQSDHEGMLTITEALQNSRKNNLPYELYIDNKKHDFNNKLIYTSQDKIIPTPDGVVIPLKVVIPEIDLVEYNVGTYNDSIYLTVSTD